MTIDVLQRKTFPLGATVYPEGVNFSLYAKNCHKVELLLFDSPDAKKPARTIPLDPKKNKTFYYWHMFVPGLKAGSIYAYRVYGPFEPDNGHRFDGSKVLLDPYAKAIVGQENYDRDAACEYGVDNCAHALKCVVVDNSTYDWEGDHHPYIPYAKTVIYEMHVAGFTKNPNSGIAPAKRGSYAGIIEKIPYLKALGITAVELMPIHEFDPQDAPLGNPNYWGYSTVAFFAPHRGYSSRRDHLGHLDEFRDLVKALHRAGIEVILDVVFNHTAEGNHQGPTLSLRGLENKTYYILENDKTHYTNYSGCGNTVRANHHIVSRLIIDCLRYWVSEMHVDGFRFDLASVMSRDKFGNPVTDPLVIWGIESDPILAGTKIIAEPWDAAGLYQVGSFIGDRFAEWNGQFRDDVRRFVKSDQGAVAKLAARMMGSPDIYDNPDREPNHSINFVTCHDGFTLMDLVSYNQKHNLANGEKNRDGCNDNFSWNCGWEGKINDPTIEFLRRRQLKNLITILMLSQGTPMLSMGDEVGRTQKGNNNAYCQDNELSWMDWNLIENNSDILRFVKGLIHFTQTRELFAQERILATVTGTDPHIIWHGTCLNQQKWEEYSHSLAFELCHPQRGEHLYIMMNAYWEKLTYELPVLPGKLCWHRLVDTALAPPWDFSQPATAPAITDYEYLVGDRSCVVLIALEKTPSKSSLGLKIKL